MASERTRHEIIADGRGRAIEVHRQRILAAVHARHVRELQEAGLLRRVALRVRIALEVRRELERVAPGDGLYANGS